MDINQLSHDYVSKNTFYGNPTAPNGSFSRAMYECELSMFIAGYKSALQMIDEKLAAIEDYAHGDAGNAITKLRNIIS